MKNKTKAEFKVNGHNMTFEMITCLTSEIDLNERTLAMLIHDKNVKFDDGEICYWRDLPVDESEAFDIISNECLESNCEILNTVEPLEEGSIYHLIASSFSMNTVVFIHDERMREVYAGIAYAGLDMFGHLEVLDFSVEKTLSGPVLYIMV